MKRWFQNLKVAQKLMLISVFFVLPDSVMLYLFINAINDNIEFARMEVKGNQYQRPLEDLLELIPQHRQLAHRLLDGETALASAIAQKSAEIDTVFQRLEEVDAKIGTELQFTDEGLAKRHREHIRVQTVRAEWEELKTQLSGLSQTACAERHVHLVADVREMIRHSGDTSNLILDPDLDSYYLMDATLLALPQAQDRIAEVMAAGQAILRQPEVSQKDRQQFAIFVTMLQQEDLDHITNSVRTSLREDPNFYGINQSLQTRVPPALEEYIVATKALIGMTKQFVDAEKPGITPEEYVAAGEKAREASFKLWRIADEEVDALLQSRIESYQGRRARSLLVAIGALLAAVGFVTFITRSISGPLRKQAADLQSANAALQAEIAERERAEMALRTAEEKYRGIFENAVEGIFQSTADGHYLVANPTLVRMYGYGSIGELQDAMTDIGTRLYVDSQRRSEFQRRIAQEGTLHHFESQVYRKDGSMIWISEHARAVHDAAGALLYYEGTVEDITERKRNEEELEKLHDQVVETSRLAGMAEVATGVLHNVGNVLNSVNVSAMLVVDRLSKSRIAHLANVAAMLREHSADLAQFLTTDPKGMKLPAFIGSLAERLSVEQGELLRELEGLTKNVSHIKEIVAVQQSYAKVSGVFESLAPTDLVADALEMNGAAFDRHGVEVTREFAEVPHVLVDKHKVLQILINVIRNAKYAVSESSRRDKRITVSIGLNEDRRVKIAVADNGIGIAKENLARIFAHGFTTKKDGHGFGLHSAALAATETGGSLSVHSNGPGHGATFILELPMDETTKRDQRTAALAH
ncbi:MAG: PAS domain S-box protein [Chthoniobacteraceae bacterium]